MFSITRTVSCDTINSDLRLLCRCGEAVQITSTCAFQLQHPGGVNGFVHESMTDTIHEMCSEYNLELIHGLYMFFQISHIVSESVLLDFVSSSTNVSASSVLIIVIFSNDATIATSFHICSSIVSGSDDATSTAKVPFYFFYIPAYRH